ncbi:MAG: endonuclease/exonuclease/phosphatase family protein [Pirellulales bacterium]|nr:endonuclease/exonuclease/phosphatase family protein [Pirellulales bacterium]
MNNILLGNALRNAILRNSFLGVILFYSLPVTPNASGQITELGVMTFNVWIGEDTQTGQDKLVEIIQAGGADIIGIQEMNNTILPEIALALGFYYHQQSGWDIQILSRFPIVGQSPGNLGVEIALTPNVNVWLFNAHLAAYPYQPYDLRDGSLPQDEAAVIAAAYAARGSQVTTYLDDMNAALASGNPIFFTGDFNEPSHLDWTQAAADSTDRPFDLKVAYPTSSRIRNAGMQDSFRAVRSNEVNEPAYTWTPGAPPPNLDANEVHDRIDIIYHTGFVIPTNAFTIGLDSSNPNTDLGVAGYNSDHRAVVVDYEIAALSFLPGDVNLDGLLSGDGTGSWAEDDVTAFIAGWMTVVTEDNFTERWMKGDLNLNGRSEIGDIIEFQQALLAAGLEFLGFESLVPEPASCPLAVIMGIISLFVFGFWSLGSVLMQSPRVNSKVIRDQPLNLTTRPVQESRFPIRALDHQCGASSTIQVQGVIRTQLPHPFGRLGCRGSFAIARLSAIDCHQDEIASIL